MTATAIPWRENATAVLRPRVSGGFPVAIERDGPLLEVVQALMRRPAKDLPYIRVSLPDRRRPPYMYEGLALADLMKASKLIDFSEALSIFLQPGPQ